jgi:23S rRNA (uracil1939-C5)-methyltransferase
VAETVTISALGHSGDGIAEADGARLFVPLTLPGETVEIERDEGTRAHLLRVVTPSPTRVAPICRHFGVCGNCALEHMERGAYLDWKRQQVVAAFAQRGIADAPVEATVASEFGGRRRAVFSAIRAAKGTILGFHRRASDEIIDIEECPVLAPAITGKLGQLRAIATLALKRWKPARVTVLAADNGLDIAITGGAKPDAAALTKLGAFGADTAIARLTLDGAEVFRNREPEIASGDATLKPTPGGFVQASAAAEAAMADALAEHIGTSGPVADLFSGIGTFSLRLAKRAPVTAVESDPTLLAALDAAARRAKGRKAITARRRDLFANPLASRELANFGAVVFDPPAAGAKAQAEMLAKSEVAKIAAVSCNPATLARDARILADGGYRLMRVVPIDQFLFSAEIEAVALFQR